MPVLSRTWQNDVHKVATSSGLKDRSFALTPMHQLELRTVIILFILMAVGCTSRPDARACANVGALKLGMSFADAMELMGSPKYRGGQSNDPPEIVSVAYEPIPGERTFETGYVALRLRFESQRLVRVYSAYKLIFGDETPLWELSEKRTFKSPEFDRYCKH